MAVLHRRGRKAIGLEDKIVIKAPRSEACRGIKSFLEDGQVDLAGPFEGAKPIEVVGVDLAIDQGDVPAQELLDDGDKGDLGGIRREGKHRFAEKGRSKRDTVKPPHKAIFLPCFDAVGDTSFVKSNIGLFHLVGDPRSILAGAWDMRAGFDHLGKGGVDAQSVSVFAQVLSQAAVDQQIGTPQHKARIGRIPQDRLAFAIPWEDPATVAEFKALGAQIASDRDGAKARCVVGIGEYKVSIESIDRHDGDILFFAARIQAW